MRLTVEQVTAMASDASSVSASRKLMSLRSWESLGKSDEALWGKCQGSAVYQVRIDASNLGYHCSCPSRKFPCKHVLGLMMLFATSADSIADATTPDWVDEWLQKRRQREEKQVEKVAQPKKPVNTEAQEKRTVRREALVGEGLQRLDLWMKDLIRNGLASVETQHGIWDEQAKRLVDAQAPGVASRISRLAQIPRSSKNWPERLLAELGRIKLMIHAFNRLDHLSPKLQNDLRQMIGWTVNKDELEADGERVEDSWIVIGQSTDDEERVRSQRSWLTGRRTGRMALYLQFAVGSQPFAESLVPGTEQQGTLVFYPGASPQRARFASRDETLNIVEQRIPGHESIDAFLESVSTSIAAQPWLSGFAGVLNQITIAWHDEQFLIRDMTGNALPLTTPFTQHWKLAALTGGHPFDLCAEWNGFCLKPMGLFLHSEFRTA